MLRCVEPELLDELPAGAPEAIASRGDLQRVNWWLGHAGIFQRVLSEVPVPAPRRVVELGAGDGTFLLRLAAQWPGRETKITALLVDRQDLVTTDTRSAFAALGWEVQTIQADVFDWLLQPGPPADWLLANLFLHHFKPERLRDLLSLAGTKTSLFAACEPRRTTLPLVATRLLGLIGCNAVTRHDARVSVRAGFTGDELSALWSAAGQWRLREHPAGPFSHCFVARRK